MFSGYNYHCSILGVKGEYNPHSKNVGITGLLALTLVAVIDVVKIILASQRLMRRRNLKLLRRNLSEVRELKSARRLSLTTIAGEMTIADLV